MCVPKAPGIAYLASSNSSNPFSNIFSFLYCSTNALRFLNLSNWSIIRLNSYQIYAVSTPPRAERTRGEGGTYRGDAGVVREHEPADAVRGADVRRLARERDLDRRGAPRDEVGELALADAQQRLMHLRLASQSVARA